MKANKQTGVRANETTVSIPQTTGEVVRVLETAFSLIDTSIMVSSAELRDALRAKTVGRFTFLSASFTAHNQGAFHVIADNVNYCGTHLKGKVISIERL